MIKFLGSLIPSRFHETPDGLYHGKSDQQKTQNNITTEQNRQNTSQQQNISDSQQRVQDTTNRSNNERGSIWSGYSGLAGNPGAGGAIDQSASDRLLSGNYSSVGNNTGTPGSGGGGGGGGGTGGGPSYLDTFNELSNSKTGGFDPTRLGNINSATHDLYDTSGNYGQVDKNIGDLSSAQNNYGATNTSIGGLQKFAATGGLNADQLGNINRTSLTDMEKTGGYSDADIANERARANAGAASTYSNLSDQLKNQRLTGASVGPGLAATGFKLARQSAQDQATAAQNTEASIHQNVNANKLAAGSKLGELGLGTAQLQSNNTLTGYTNSGNMDISKNQSIQDAWNKAGQLGLGKQAQIDAAKEAAAGIDQNTQGLINNTRLSAAGGLSQDTLGRMSIGASSGAAAAANALGYANLNSANQRFLISEQDANRNTGLGGMLNTYTANPSDQQFQQNLLRGYNQDATGANQGLINDRINASTIPGIGSTIGAGLNVAGKVAGLAGGVTGGLSGMFGGGGSSGGGYSPMQGTMGSPMMGYGASSSPTPFIQGQAPLAQYGSSSSYPSWGG